MSYSASSSSYSNAFQASAITISLSSVCTTCKTSSVGDAVISYEGECGLVFLFNMADHMTLSFILCRSDLLPEVYTRCDNAAFANFVAAISRTNSNQFELAHASVCSNIQN